MDRDKLIDLAKKLLFKISETEKSRQDIIRENKKIKSEEEESGKAKEDKI